MAEWEIEGYDGLELLGFGTAGELWRASDTASGLDVALRRLPGDNPDVVAVLLATAAVVQTLPSRHLVRLRTTVRSGGDDILVLDLARGGALSALLADHGTLAPGQVVLAGHGILAPGQVVTAVAPIAEALGQAHARGLIHGDVGLSAVLLTEDGMPLLDGLGMAALPGWSDPAERPEPSHVHPLPAPAEQLTSHQHVPAGGLLAMADVGALGALCLLLLTGEPDGELPMSTPGPLRRAIAWAVEADPRKRPCAAEFSAALLLACPALPLPSPRRASTVGAPTRSLTSGLAVRTHRRPAPRTLLVTGTALALLLAVGAGWSWGEQVDAPVGRAPAALPGPRTPAAPGGSLAPAEPSTATPTGPATAAAGAAPGLRPAVPPAAPPGSRLAVPPAAPAVRPAAALPSASTAPRPATAAAACPPPEPKPPPPAPRQPPAPPQPPAPATKARATAASGEGAAGNWRQVVATLDAAREVAFSQACSAMLTGVWAAGARQQAADLRLVDDLARLRRTAVGVRHRIWSVTVVRRRSGAVELEVVEAMQSYRVRRADLSTVARVAAGPPTTGRMVLAQTAAGWRLVSVRA